MSDSPDPLTPPPLPPPPGAEAWYRFARLHLLGLGSVLLAIGVVFFVAANWSDLTPNQRLGLVAGALVASALTGAVLGLGTLSGRMAVLLAGLLFGPLIALYGQIYQTGADAWEIYALWTLVLAGFAALARLQGGWVLWLALLHFTAWVFTFQSVTQAGMFSAPGLPVVAALAAVYALIIASLERRASVAPRGGRQSLLIYAAAGLGLWSLVGCAATAISRSNFGTDTSSSGLPWRATAVLLALAALAAIYATYRRRIPDLLLLATGAAGACVLLTSLISKLMRYAQIDDTAFFLLLGLAICGQVWLLATWLLDWRRRHAARPMESPTESRPVEGNAEETAAAQPELQALDGSDTSSDVARDTPWFVHLFVGLGTWIGAIVLAIFLGVAGLLDNPVAAGVLGALLYLGALVLGMRGSTAVFAVQLTWVLAVTGQVCLFVAVLDGGSDVSHPLLLALLQLPVLAFVRLPLLRLAAAFALVGWLTWLCGALELHPFFVQLLALGVATIVIALWWQRKSLADAPAGETHSLWRPLGLGLAIGMAIPLLATLHAWPLGQLDTFLPRPILALAFAALTLVVLQRALRQVDISVSRPPVLAAFAGLLVVALLTMDVPGVSAGLLLLVLGFWRRERWLSAFGLLYVGGFLFDFYYRLDVPLLEKSLWVTGSGFVLLLSAIALRRLVARERETGTPGEGHPDAGPARTAPQLGALAALVLVALAIPGWQSYQKQQIVDSGRTVLLELRPIDPRSLMQGDYMVLNYQLHQAASEQEVLQEQPRRGHLVVRLDAQGVAEFESFWDGSATLEADQQLLDYRQRLQRWGSGNELRLGIESFFFEEGRAGFFSNAKYAELRVSEDGEPVLVGLRGPEMQVLGGG